MNIYAQSTYSASRSLFYASISNFIPLKQLTIEADH